MIAQEITRIPLSRGLNALIDISDAELVGGSKWHAVPRARTWYAARAVYLPDGRQTTQYLHALLTGYPRTDHINGDGLDNRRLNLRAATHAENMGNRRKTRGSSRFKGVSWAGDRQRWHASIMIAGRTMHLGRFASEDAAAHAYDEAARIHFGEFAAVNFPRSGERSALTPIETE